MGFWCAPVGALLVHTCRCALGALLMHTCGCAFGALQISLCGPLAGFCGCMGLLPDNTSICMKLKRISCTKYSGYRVRSADC